MSLGKQSTNYVGRLIVGSLSSSLRIMLALLSYTPRTTCPGMLSSIVPKTPPHQLKVKKFLIGLSTEQQLKIIISRYLPFLCFVFVFQVSQYAIKLVQNTQQNLLCHLGLAPLQSLTVSDDPCRESVVQAGSQITSLMGTRIK